MRGTAWLSPFGERRVAFRANQLPFVCFAEIIDHLYPIYESDQMAPPKRPDKATATCNKIRTRIISCSDSSFECCIFGCGNKQRELRCEFFPLPEGNRRVSWLKALGRSDLLNQDDLSSYKICPSHYRRALKAEKKSRIALASATRRYRNDGWYHALMRKVLANGHDIEKLREGFYEYFFSYMYDIQDKNYVPMNYDDEKENQF